MLTKEFLTRANALPAPAKAQLADFLEFLEAKYGASIQPMSVEEFEHFLDERLEKVNAPTQKRKAFEALAALRTEF